MAQKDNFIWKTGVSVKEKSVCGITMHSWWHKRQFYMEHGHMLKNCSVNWLAHEKNSILT